MSDYKVFANEALANLKTLVETSYQDLTKEAIKDGKDFLEKSKKDLQRWLTLRAAGQLTNADLEWLIKGKKDVARLQALKQAGVSLARLDAFRQDLITLAINTAASAAVTGLDQIGKKTKGKSKPA